VAPGAAGAGDQGDGGMKRWNRHAADSLEAHDIDAFLDEIEAVCRKHGLSIGHEERTYAFEIEEFSESDMNWLKLAQDVRRPGAAKSKP
jgi:hypothetical protein